jgi:hypothetical protein
MMDRNLGATSATPGDIGAFGLMYQWGRKDPFLGGCELEGTTLAVSTGSWSVVSGRQTIDYTDTNPTTFVTVDISSDWCNGLGSGSSNYKMRWMESEKTLYDPCPVGYRVPKGGDEGFWAIALGTSSPTSEGTMWDDNNKGRLWPLADGNTIAWYPTTGRLTNSKAFGNTGKSGCIWSASHYDQYTVWAPDFSSSDFRPRGSNYRGNGYPVRCVKE